MRTGQLGLLVCVAGALAASSACESPEPGANTPARGAVESVAPYDPVTMDPTPVDVDHPPLMEELTLQSGGATLNGLIYVAQGAGPHPTVLLLHGYPGNERNLDLAQAIRRSGVNVLFFDYRGSWGSGGKFSLANAIDDVAAAVAFVRSQPAQDSYRGDPDRVALIGHSFGAFLALISGAQDPSIECVASLAGPNLGPVGRAARGNEQVAAGIAAALGAAVDAQSGPIRGDVAAAVEELTAHADEYDTALRAPALSDRPLLLVAGTRDSLVPKAVEHDTLMAALREAGANRLTELVLDDDHYFSASRVALARAVVGWLHDACGY